MAVGGLEKQIEAVRPSADESQSHTQTKRRRCLHDVDIIIRGDEGNINDAGRRAAFIK